MNTVFTNPRPQFFDDVGKIVSNGTLTFYYDDTTTLKAVYSDSTTTTPIQNPSPLTNSGRVRDGGIWLGEGNYFVVLKDKNGRKIWDMPVAGSQSVNTSLFTTGFVRNIATLRNLSLGQYTLVYMSGYYNPGDGGQGWFYYDATSSNLDDGGAYIEPSTAPANGRWIRIFDGEKVYSRQWGVIDSDSGAKQGALLNMCNFAAIGDKKTAVIQSDIVSVNASFTLTGNINLEIENGMQFSNIGVNPITITISTRTLDYKYDTKILNDDTITLSVFTTQPCEYPLSMWGSKLVWETLEKANDGGYNGLALVYGDWTIYRASGDQSDINFLNVKFMKGGSFTLMPHGYSTKILVLQYEVEDGHTACFRGSVKDVLRLRGREHKLSYFQAGLSYTLSGEELVDKVLNPICWDSTLLTNNKLIVDIRTNWTIIAPSKVHTYKVDVEFVDGAIMQFGANVWQRLGTIVNNGYIFNPIYTSAGGAIFDNQDGKVTWWDCNSREVGNDTTNYNINSFGLTNAIKVCSYNGKDLDLQGNTISQNKSVFINNDIVIKNGTIRPDFNFWTVDNDAGVLRIQSGVYVTLNNVTINGNVRHINVENSGASLKVDNCDFIYTSGNGRVLLNASGLLDVNNSRFTFTQAADTNFVGINLNTVALANINFSTFNKCKVNNGTQANITNCTFNGTIGQKLPYGTVALSTFIANTNLNLNAGQYFNNRFINNSVIYDHTIASINDPFILLNDNTFLNSAFTLQNPKNIDMNDNQFISIAATSRIVLDADTASYLCTNVQIHNTKFINNFTGTAYNSVLQNSNINASGHTNCVVTGSVRGGQHPINYNGTSYNYGVKVTIDGTLGAGTPYNLGNNYFGTNVTLPTGWEVLRRFSNRYTYINASALLCNNRKSNVIGSGDGNNNVIVWGVPVFGSTSIFDVMIDVKINDNDINNVSL